MSLNDYAAQSHIDAKRFWHEKDGTRKERNKGELIALMHSELSEMLEGIRKDKQDEHLPLYKSEHVELVDLLIRAFDYAGAHGINLDEIYYAKRNYNAIRIDHTYEVREAAGGKKF